MGRPKSPDSAHAMLSVRVSEALHKEVQMVAMMDGATVADYLRELVSRDIEAKKARPDWHEKRDAVLQAQITELKTRLEALKGN